ncbi:hypothetical protein MN202_16310 [Rheinheimera muenzenbergensis]|uniref:Tetratricopeptide repeat-containing protein n=1 Tax=Rheinheimera muenzenbergensis TaxID=1193628 RepID=A0ABU8CA76_9GAMM
MPRITALLLLLFSLNTLATETLQTRLTEAGNNAEQVSNALLSMPADNLTTEDWLVLTEAQRRLRNKEAALDAVNRALQSSRQPFLQAQAYLLKAQVYGILYRDTAIAITQLELAERLVQQAEDNDSLTLYSEVLQSFAQAYNQLGDVTRAIPYAEKSLALAVRQQQADAELSARIILGRLTLQNNAYGQAHQHLQHALALATRLNNTDALASIHFRLGMAYRKINDHVQALQHLQHAKQYYQAVQNHSSYVYSLIYIGETYLEDANTAEQAAAYLNEARTLAEQQNDLLRIGMVTLGQGRLAVLQQQPELALRYFNDAVQLFRQQNVQTYLLEAHLALAELLLQQGQQQQAAQLLTEHSAQMPQAASYLRYRYHDLASRIDAARNQWPDAYQHLLQASLLKFQQVTEQSALQLDMLNKSLTNASADSQLQQQAQQLQHKQQQLQHQLNVSWLALALALLTMLIFSALWWRSRRQLLLTSPGISNWQHFCQRLQQKRSDTLWLLAITSTHSLKLKQHYGEQRLQLLLQQYVQQFAPELVLASCLSDDVLWLAVQSDAQTISQQQTEFLSLLQTRFVAAEASIPLLSLALPVTELLGARWRASDVSALRETLWLSLACCEQQGELSYPLLLSLRANKPRACEWRSNLVRQDVLSALQLGDLSLHCNGRVLPASGFELTD